MDEPPWRPAAAGPSATPPSAADREVAQRLLAAGRLDPGALELFIAEQTRRGGPSRVPLAAILAEHGLLAPGELTPWSPAPGPPRPSGPPGHGPAPAPGSGSGPGAAVERDAVGSEVRRALADPSRRLGRYVLLGELGRGGMGVVYRAWDESLLREVAIKTFLSMPSGSGGVQLERFRREARAAARLRHPGIVAVHEVGEQDGRPFLVMDLVRGQSLESLLCRETPSPRGVAEIARRLCDALHHAHEQGIVHRDVKPENVLVDERGEPRLTDFGLAREVGANSSGGGERLTLTGQVIGTPAYMAPEQVGGRADAISPRTDVYSVGALLYRALCGRPPFEAESAVVVLTAKLQRDPEALRRHRPELHADLETITLRCLEREPGRRYASAGEVAAELGRFLKGEAILARPIGRRERLRRWVGRNRLATAGILALCLAPLGAGAAVIASRRAQTTALARGRADRMEQARGQLEQAEAAAARALAHYEEALAPLWERRALVLAAGDLREWFAGEPKTEVEAVDRLRAEGLSGWEGGARETWLRRRDERERRRRQGAQEEERADALFAQARDLFTAAGDGAAARRAEGRRFLHLGRLLFASGGGTQALYATVAGRYLDTAAGLLDAEDADLAAARAHLNAGARLRVALERDEGAVASLFAVDPTTLAIAEEPLAGRADLPLPLDEADLPAGEYIVKIRRRGDDPGAPPISFPVLLAPGDDWVSELPVSLDDIPDGLVYVPAGPFLLGTRHGMDDESPPRFASIDAFLIGRDEVSHAELLAFVERSGYRTLAEQAGFGWIFRGELGFAQIPGASFRHPRGPGDAADPSHPAIQIAWDDARAFARERGWRLPTEIEWEKAVRGIDGRLFPWGEGPAHERDAFGGSGLWRGNLYTNPDTADGFRHTAPVGSFPAGASPYGLRDAAGNVREWCENAYAGDGYWRSEIDVPIVEHARMRAIRGGAWDRVYFDGRITRRDACGPQVRRDEFGFRVAAGVGRSR